MDLVDLLILFVLLVSTVLCWLFAPDFWPILLALVFVIYFPRFLRWAGASGDVPQWSKLLSDLCSLIKRLWRRGHHDGLPRSQRSTQPLLIKSFRYTGCPF